MIDSAIRKAILSAAVAMVPSMAMAHPHVFAEARLEVKAASDGSIERLQNVWRFDDLFSATVLLEFDANSDGMLDDTELAEVTSVVTESTSQYDYFLAVSVEDREIGIAPVTDMKAWYDDGQLILLFTAGLKETVMLADKPHIGVYDPTFYTAIEFYSEGDMALIDAPEICSFDMVVPDPEEAIAQNQQSLTEAFFNDPGGNDLSKLLATRMEVSCG